MSGLLKNKKLMIILSVILVTLLAVGGALLAWQLSRDDAPKGDVYTVTFTDGADTVLAVVEVTEGETVEEGSIPFPSRSGYQFKGWFTDEALTTAFDSDMPITASVICYPYYTDLSDMKLGSVDALSGGIVPADHKVVIRSDDAITSENLSEHLNVEAFFGEIPTFAVASLGDGKYELAADYPAGGHYQFELLSEGLSFDGMHEGVRKYDIEIAALAREVVEENGAIILIDEADILEFARRGEESATLKVYGEIFVPGMVLEIPHEDGTGSCYVVSSVDREINEHLPSGKKYYELSLAVAGLADVYENVDIFSVVDQSEMQAEYVSEEEIAAQVENSEEILIFADYLGMAINDAPEFKHLVEEGKASPLTLQSQTLRHFAETSDDPEIKKLLSYPGLNLGNSLEIKVEKVKLNKNATNEWWGEAVRGTKEFNPKTGKFVDADPKTFSRGFTMVEIVVSFSYIPSEAHGVEIKATASFRQYFKFNASYNVAVKVDWGSEKSLKQSNIDVRTTTFLATELSLDVTVKTQASGTKAESINISDTIKEILKGKEEDTGYSSTNNKYIEMFRRLYDGGSGKDIEVFTWNICTFYIDIGKVLSIEIPFDFFVKMNIQGGVGIEYEYYTSFNIGIVSPKDSKEVRSYATANKDSQSMTIYAAGHIGVKAGIRGGIGITFTKLNLVEITLTAEFGVYADLYGYYYLNYTKEYITDHIVKDSGGAYYFDFGLYATVELEVTAFWVISEDWTLYEWKQSLATFGDRYVLAGFLDLDGTPTEPDEAPETIILNIDSLRRETLTLKGFSRRDYYTTSIDNLLGSVWYDLITVKNVNASKVADARKKLYANISLDSKTGPNIFYDPATGKIGIYEGTYKIVKDEIAAASTEFAFTTATITLRYEGSSFSFKYKPEKTVKIVFGRKDFIDRDVDPTKPLTVNFLDPVDQDVYQSFTDIPYGSNIGSLVDRMYEVYYKDVEWREKNYVFDLSFDPKYYNTRLHSNTNVIPQVVYQTNNDVWYRLAYLTKDGLQWSEVLQNENGLVTGIPVHSGPMHTPDDYASYITDTLGGTPLPSEAFRAWNMVGTDPSQTNDLVTSPEGTVIYEALYDEEILGQSFNVTVRHYGFDGALESTSEHKVAFGETVNVDEHPYFSYAYEEHIEPVSGELLYGTVPMSDVVVDCKHVESLPTVFYMSNLDNSLRYSEQIPMGTVPTSPASIPSVASYYLEDGSFARLASASYNAYAAVDTHQVVIKLEYKLDPKITLLNANGLVYQEHIYPTGIDLNDGSFIGPDKPADEQYTYVFSHWENVEGAHLGAIVTERATYRPVYTATERSYYMIFAGQSGVSVTDGTPLRIAEMPLYSEIDAFLEAWFEGKTIVKATDVRASYTYTGYTYSLSGGVCQIELQFDEKPHSSSTKPDGTPVDPGNPDPEPDVPRPDNYFVATLDVGDVGMLKKGDQYWSNDYAHGLSLDENGRYVMDFTVIPTSEDYEFVGWRYGDTLYKSGDVMTLAAGGSGCFTAVLELKDFKLDFVVDGEIAHTVYANGGDAVYLPRIAPKESDTDKYYIRATGWRDTANELHAHDFYTVTENMTFTAEFETVPRLYTVTFLAGEHGTFAFPVPGSDDLTQWASSYYYEELPSPLAAIRGDAQDGYRYEFIGWSDREGGEVIDVPEVTDDATYYAIYEKVTTYTVTFDAGEGVLDLNGNKRTSITVDAGYVIKKEDLPDAFRRGNGGYHKLMSWGDAKDSTVTADVTFTAFYEEAVTKTGILVSDGVNTEDIAAYLSADHQVEGYVYDVTDGYDHLVVTASGLTLSGRSAEPWIEILDGVTVRMKDLFLSWSEYNMGSITAYGRTVIEIDGVVTLSAVEGRGEVLRGENLYDYETGETTANAHMTVKGIGEDSLLVVNSKQYGIVLYDYEKGLLELTDLNARITVSATEYESGTALMSAYDLRIVDSTVAVHEGRILAAALALEDSTLELLDEDSAILLMGYDENGRLDAPILSMTASSLSFEGGIALAMRYEALGGIPTVAFNYDEEAMCIVRRYDTYEAFDEALGEALTDGELAALVAIDGDSSVSSVQTRGRVAEKPLL